MKSKELECREKENELISNRLFELKKWLSDQPGHPTHLSNLPQWFWEDWGECILELKSEDFLKDIIAEREMRQSINFADFITDEPSFDDFYLMSKEQKERVYKEFLKPKQKR
jgi:hypothetical protein